MEKAYERFDAVSFNEPALDEASVRFYAGRFVDTAKATAGERLREQVGGDDSVNTARRDSNDAIHGRT